VSAFETGLSRVEPQTSVASVEAFLEGVASSLRQWVGVSREDLHDFITDQAVVAMTSHFLATGDQGQLAILAFRLNTFARNRKLDALVRIEDQLTTAFIFASNVAFALI